MPASETPVSRGPGETLWCRVEGGLVRINQGAVIVMFAVMFVLVFVNVVTRYLFRFSIPWAEEVAGYLLVWMAYLGAGLALREGRHVAVTVVQRALPERIARPLRAILVVVTFAFVILLAYAGIRYARLAWPQKTPILRAPLGAVYLAIPAGVLRMAYGWRIDGGAPAPRAPSSASGTLGVTHHGPRAARLGRDVGRSVE